MTLSKKFLINSGILLLLTLAIASPLSFRVDAQSATSNNESLPTNWGAYEPDGSIGSPGRREGGGTRGPCVENNVNHKVTALIPLNGFGITIADYPTFSVYIPQLSAESNPEIEFVLRTAEKKEIYKTKFNIKQGGIVSFILPNNRNVPGLKLNQNYFWTVTLICNPEAIDTGDVSGNKKVEGIVIRRVTPNASLRQELAAAKSLRDRVKIYAKAGIWYDAFSNLAELRRRNPTDPIVVRDWRELLKSVGMEELAQEPILPPLVGANQLSSDVTPSN